MPPFYETRKTHHIMKHAKHLILEARQALYFLKHDKHAII